MSLSARAMSGGGLSGRDLRLASARGLVGGRGRAAEFQGGVDLTAARLDWDQMRLEDVGGRARVDAVIDAVGTARESFLTRTRVRVDTTTTGHEAHNLMENSHG